MACRRHDIGLIHFVSFYLELNIFALAIGHTDPLVFAQILMLSDHVSFLVAEPVCAGDA